MVFDIVTGGVEIGCDLRVLYGPPYGGCADVAERCGFQGFAGVLVLDLVEESDNVAGMGVDGVAMTNRFFTDGILLVIKCEVVKVCMLEVL